MAKDIVKFTPLLETPGLFCHLLELNDTKILVNCGTNYYMDTSNYVNILPIIMECDVILITGFGLEYIGALPFIISHNYYKPIYMTLPNKILGNIVLEEQMNILKNYYKFDLKRTCNILDNSEVIIDIKYMQPFNIKDINICAYNSGYSLGSTLFKITVGVQNIYLGFNLNHRKENLLDGVDLNKIKDPFLFITNSNYINKDDVSCKIRDGDIKKFIDKYLGKKMRLIFVIDYTRFLELALILNSIKNKKIVCLAYQLKKFIERAKSMIEWSGSKTLETFYKEKSNPFEFDNIDFVEWYTKLGDFEILVLLDENIISPVTSSIINKYNTENTIIIFFNEDKEDKFVRESMSKRIYDYTGRIIEQHEESSSESSEISEEELDSSEEKDNYWSNLKYEIWREKTFKTLSKEKRLPITKNIDDKNFNGKLNFNDKLNFNGKNIEDIEYEIIYGKLNFEQEETITEQNVGILSINEEIRFPLDKKPRNYDNYGEYIDKDKFKQKRMRIEEVKKERKLVESIYIEDKIHKSTGLHLKCLTTTLNFSGTCDLNSIKMILQNSEAQKIVIVPDDYDSGKMFYYSFIYSNSISQYYICLDTLNLSADTSVSIVNLSEDFLKIDYKTIGNDNIAQFKGIKNGNVIEYLGKPDDIMVANLELNDLKKKLIENNLKVETHGNVLIVEKNTILKLDGNELFLEGEHSDFYYYIRNILYQNIAII